jgi:hypothetical protein
MSHKTLCAFSSPGILSVIALFQQLSVQLLSVQLPFSPVAVFITNQFAPCYLDRRACSVIRKLQNFLCKT